ncbi:hypothetical protein EVB27_073 [Rhizobium phage RHph_TM16]|nr:hypothetical protein EVB27_073 [Rhizobium phage RHph_TM16]
MRQVGKALGILATFEAKEIVMHADIAAFGAPGECHGLVSKGEAKRAREARRHAKAVSGLSRRGFNQELRKWKNTCFIQRAVSRIADRLNPYY